MVKMLAVECVGLLGLRHSQGGAAVPPCFVGGVEGDEFARLGRVRVVPRRGRCEGSQSRIEVCVVGSGSERGRGRGRAAGKGRWGDKCLVQAVASAYPPIAQTEKTFRLPIDYYQVSFRTGFFTSFFSGCGNDLDGFVARICLSPML